MKPLKANGLHAHYFDESAGDGIYVVSSVRIPIIAPRDDTYELAWGDFRDAAIAWRRDLSKNHDIYFHKELHAADLITGHSKLHKPGRSLREGEALALYSDALKTLTFLPNSSITTTYSTALSSLFWATGLEAAMIGLFQRIRKSCDALGINGMAIFDEGHKEYMTWYRKAEKYLPTGSQRGAWEEGGATKNLALTMFVKDANLKDSKFSHFLQIADLVAYAALQKLKAENKKLSQKRIKRGDHTLYDLLPDGKVNLKATKKRPDGIVPINVPIK